MMPCRRSASAVESTAVGSSKTMTRTFCDRALAISTTCWWATARSPTARRGSMEKPRRRSSSPARRFSAGQAMTPGSSRRKMFSATDRSGAKAVSWWITAMPCEAATLGL